jgi:hypothetical protein
MKTSQFEIFLKTISIILLKIPTINNDTPNLYDFLFNLNENYTNNQMDDDSPQLNDQILNESLKMIDTKTFTDKMTIFLTNSSSSIDTCCYYISRICYFLLIKSKFKIHQSM